MTTQSIKLLESRMNYFLIMANLTLIIIKETQVSEKSMMESMFDRSSGIP